MLYLDLYWFVQELEVIPDFAPYGRNDDQPVDRWTPVILKVTGNHRSKDGKTRRIIPKHQGGTVFLITISYTEQTIDTSTFNLHVLSKRIRTQ